MDKTSYTLNKGRQAHALVNTFICTSDDLHSGFQHPSAEVNPGVGRSKEFLTLFQLSTLQRYDDLQDLFQRK